MGCQHLGELYELFLLCAVSAEDYAKVHEHVERQCPCCLEQLREAALSVYFLSQVARPIRSSRPDPRQKSQLLRRLRKK